MFFKNSKIIYLLILMSGLAALSWQVIWQLKATLALGVSAWGTAVILAVTMGGMCIGALGIGAALRHTRAVHPLRLYGILEIIIGLSGICVSPLFRFIEAIDTRIYAHTPGQEILVFILGVMGTLSVPTLCLGATLPVIGLIARQQNKSIADLYGVNTLGAAVGALLAAFALIPSFGVSGTIYLAAFVNIFVGITAIFLDRRMGGEILCQPAPLKVKKVVMPASENIVPFAQALFLVFVTGIVTFSLEVAWFRSFRSAFMSTTGAFAMMLASVLLALGFAARCVPLIKKKKLSLSLLIALAGITILLATPVIERFDHVSYFFASLHLITFGYWFNATLLTIGIPVFLLGLAVPWVLEDYKTPLQWGVLYGLNTLAAIIGALVAAWILLPSIGFAKTSWMAGLLTIGTGLLFMRHAAHRAYVIVGSIAALSVAVIFYSDIGVARVQGNFVEKKSGKQSKVLEAYNGPDVTTSVVESENGDRLLIIDGFVATSQQNQEVRSTHYMDWMGHLPMILHPYPKTALIIAFGTGQTSNAVRQENPDSIDIVDINPYVFKVAPFFTRNEGVLEDSRVTTTIMDGRAYIRRTNKKYDVITLEPMPPTFAGMNALYSQEFYRAARENMNPEGVVAQWLPFHLLTIHDSKSIVRTFQDIFPNSILWTDPFSGTGILLGTKNDHDQNFARKFYGYERPGIKRSLTKKQARGGVFFFPALLKKYGEEGEIVTDDNQLLAYGHEEYGSYVVVQGHTRNDKNYRVLRRMKSAE